MDEPNDERNGPKRAAAGRRPRKLKAPPAARSGCVREPLPWAVLNAHPKAALLVTPDGRILFANPAAQGLLGESADVTGRSFRDFLEDEEGERLAGALAGAAASASATSLRLAMKPAREGASRHLGVSVSAVADGPEGPCLGLFPQIEEAPPEAGLEADLFRAVEQVDESVVITDREGRFLYVNPAFERQTGWRREEVLGLTPRIVKSGRHRDEYYREMWDVILSGRSYRGTVLNKRKDQSLYYEEKTITPVFDGGANITHFVATGVDVTQKTLAQQRLRASAERFALLTSATQDGVWEWIFATGKIFLSTRWKAMLGYSEGEVGDTPEAWYALVHEEDRPAFVARVEAHLHNEGPRLESEHRMVAKDGSAVWVEVKGLAQRDAQGIPQRLVGIQADITKRRIEEIRTKEGAMHDPLTGLPNRLLFMDRLGLALLRARRNPDFKFAVLFMDLDRFKIINDGLGHLAGDRLLTEVAARFRERQRGSDTVARLGGDEFAMIIEDIRSDLEAMTFADRILTHFSRPFSLEGRDVFTSASIGIALSDPAYAEPEDMVRDADTAMYHAKNGGRSRAALFDDAMRSRAMETLEMETDLRLAVETGRIGVHYQPIVSLASGRVAGFESLARWLHPKRGYVSPSVFIPLAEECGLIHALGRIIFREACSQLRHLQSRYITRPSLMMSVNLSGVQFLRPDLLNQIELVLREFGVDPRDIKLEITESVIIEHAEHALMMIDQFKAQNIRLSIDDFGTGYSSMANLRKLPIDTVKVDQSFVRRMVDDAESLEIIRATITMAHNLGMDVIAEGIETAEEARLLRGLKCQYGQGFYFSRPVDAAGAEAILNKGWFI